MGCCVPTKVTNEPQHKVPLISAQATNYSKTNQTEPQEIQSTVNELSMSASLGPDVITPKNTVSTTDTQNNPVTDNNHDNTDNDNNHSNDHKNDNNDTDNEEDEQPEISDDIILNDTMTFLTMEQHNKLKQDGYCMLDDPLKQQQSHSLVVSGYVRQNYQATQMEKYLIREIVYFYSSRFNTEIFVELVCKIPTPQFFLVPRRNLKLSGVLMNEIENNDINKIDMNEEKVSIDTLHYVLRYLGHHKGKESAPLPCPVRSIHMNQIVTDPWDAPFIDPLEKKVIFEIIIAANALSITGLTHLACAKIATLIKQMDQKEINRIIEEEEKYRREHANDNNDNGDDENKDNVLETNKNDDKVDDDGDEHHDEDEEKDDILETHGNDDDNNNLKEDGGDDIVPDVMEDEVNNNSDNKIGDQCNGTENE